MTTQDFSEATLRMFNEAKKGNVTVFDFVTRLLNADFQVEEIKPFIQKEFGRGYSKTIKLALNFL